MPMDDNSIQIDENLSDQNEREKIAKSLFGILSDNMTLEESKEERLNKI